MFGSGKQYNVGVLLRRYQPYSKDIKSLRKFIKGMWFDPSDDIGINAILREMDVMSRHSHCRVTLRVKEKEAKKLQKMEEKGELSLYGIRMIS